MARIEKEAESAQFNTDSRAVSEVRGLLYSLCNCEGLAHPLPHQSPPKRSACVIQHPQQTALHTTICLLSKKHTHTTLLTHNVTHAHSLQQVRGEGLVWMCQMTWSGTIMVILELWRGRKKSFWLIQDVSRWSKPQAVSWEDLNWAWTPCVTSVRELYRMSTCLTHIPRRSRAELLSSHPHKPD